MSWSRRLPLPSRCRTSLASLSTFPSLSQCTPRPPARPVHASPRRGLGFLSDLSQTLTGTPLRPQDILGTPSAWRVRAITPGPSHRYKRLARIGVKKTLSCWRLLAYVSLSLPHQPPGPFPSPSLCQTGQGRGLRPSLPPNALDSLVDRLERAYSASTLRPSLPSLSDDALLLQQW